MPIQTQFLGVSDAIESDIPNYSQLDLESKYYALLNKSVQQLFQFLEVDAEDSKSFITDFVYINALSLGRAGYGFATRTANDLGYSGIRTHEIDLGGASVGGALEQAHRIIQSDEHAVVLLASAEIPKSSFKTISDLKRLNDTVCHPDWELKNGATLISMYGLLMNRMMKDTGITENDLIEITKTFRERAFQNTRAVHFEKPITEKQTAKHIASPYSSPMIAIVSDHGYACLLTSEKRAKELSKEMRLKKQKPLFVRAANHAIYSEYFIHKANFMSPAGVAMENALKNSNVKRNEIEYAWIYDCFTGMVVTQASGYFGESPKLVAETLKKGEIPIEKRTIPINLGGGILNYQAAMGLSGVTGLVDVASQYGLSANPIPNVLKETPKMSLLSGNGGVDSINSVVLFSTETSSESKSGLLFHSRKLKLNHPNPKEGSQATVLSATTVYFNPAGEIKPPYTVAIVKCDDDSSLLVNLASADGSLLQSHETIELDKTQVRLQKDATGKWIGIL